jgi:hypothetical protein
VGITLGAIGFALASPVIASVGGALLILLSVRLAYGHRGAGARHLLPMYDFRFQLMPLWWRRQMTGGFLFFLAVWLIVGSFRHVLP